MLQTMMKHNATNSKALTRIVDMEEKSDNDGVVQALNDSCQKIAIAENIPKGKNVDLLNHSQQVEQQLALIAEKVDEPPR